MRAFLKVRSTANGARVSYADKTKPKSSRERPFVIPFFIPQRGCPHRCAFCHQHTITGRREASVDQAAFATAVERFASYPHRERSRTQLAFFGGNFLGLPPGRVRQYLDWAAAFCHRGSVDSLRFSTRPDSVTPEIRTLIRDYPVHTIELGAQSMDDRVLKMSGRGHGAVDTIRAVEQLKNGGYEVGLQIMTGLPGDTPFSAAATVEALITLAPDFVRIYPTLVFAGSPLAADYQAKRYRPASLSASLDLVARLWLKLTAAGIRVARMGLQDNPAMGDKAQRLAGPYHPAFGERVQGRIFCAMAHAALKKSAGTNGRLVLRVNPRRVSVMTGPRRQNLLRLQKTLGLDNLRVKGDAALAPNQLTVDNRQSLIQPLRLAERGL